MPAQNDIRAEITRLRRQRAEAPQRAKQESLAAVLDSLDIMGALENHKRRLSHHLCCGPRAVYGLTPNPWVGAVLWQRAPGYYGYKVLTLYGVWATEASSGTPLLIIGYKHIPYSVDFFDGEAYVKLIKRDFSVYYHDDGAPPRENRSFEITFRADDRLALRERIRATLNTLPI